MAIAFIFGTQNEQTIELNYIIARSNISVAMAVSIFTFIGFVIGMFTMFSFMLRRKIKRISKQTNQNRQSQNSRP